MTRYALLLPLLLAACQPPMPDGARLFAETCSACHGPSGHGDGPVAAELPVALPDLTQLAATSGGTFPMARVLTQVHGYPGRFQRGLMPEFAPLLQGPPATWNGPDGPVTAPAPLLAVARYLEGIQD
ncbi:c-type cytochrome [Mesobacterium pallidum]|uniref:c-type cytochrome n=1 Tax=Mesobacterium pallidum TaxID=2872037 RepID=UPI001EE32C1D|nr:c-type cytochrome [Mesobacterium pallidum]